MKYKNLLVEVTDGVMVITINREDKMNALNLVLLGELKQAVKQVYDDPEVKGAIITGKGNKAFAAGADIAEFAGFKSAQGREMAESGHAIFNAIENCPKPFIAAVNGFALGGGCELAMACHIRIAGETAKFGQPEVNLGIIPGYGGTQRMAQLVGKGRAFELLMTGDMINAAEAYRIGLVNKLGHNESLVETAGEIIKKIAVKAPLAIARVIQSVNALYAHDKDGMQVEITEFANCMDTADFKEGTSAFLEKRKPAFKGR